MCGVGCPDSTVGKETEEHCRSLSLKSHLAPVWSSTLELASLLTPVSEHLYKTSPPSRKFPTINVPSPVCIRIAPSPLLELESPPSTLSLNVTIMVMEGVLHMDSKEGPILPAMGHSSAASSLLSPASPHSFSTSCPAH